MVKIEQDDGSVAQQPAIKQEEGMGEGGCTHCRVTHSPMWRRSPTGQRQCNACNLYWRKHGTPRPLELANRGRAEANHRVRVAVKQEEPTPTHEHKPVVVKAEPMGRDWDAEGFAPASRVRQVRRSMRSGAVERPKSGLPEDFDFEGFMGL